ncbi:MAG: outer membrane beta-barrel protein, partial [Bacteroidota bacterium]
GFFIARVEAQQATLDNQSEFPRVDSTNLRFRNLLPFVMYRMRMENQANLRLIYRGRTNPPSITQLQDVIDNSNPVQLSTGNPDLQQDYQHFFMARYNATQSDKNRMIMGFVSGQFTQNYIANSSLIANQDTIVFDYLVPAGTQLTQPVNLDGYWNVRTLVNYGQLIERLRLNVNLSLSADYNRRPGLINGLSNFTNTATLGTGVVLSSNISEKVDFTISSRGSFNDVTNSFLTAQNTQYYNQTSKVRVNWIFGPGIVLRSELNHQMYRGLSEAFNTDFWLWNASVGKKLFKNQRGEIQLSIFDMLRQNTSIQRNVTELYIEDVQTAVLQRYAMLTFTYQLRNFRTAGIDPTQAPVNPQGFPPPGGRPPGGPDRP